MDSGSAFILSARRLPVLPAPPRTECPVDVFSLQVRVAGEAHRPEIDWDRLRRPVPKESLQVRPGARTKDGAQALIIAYIDADYVAETLDTVIGPGNWRTEYQEITDAGVIAVRRSIAIRVGDEWIEKWDYG